MKGRSSTDTHKDWVDGSWNVDCICGVNFDDGEDMVKCDDCGVWVHALCSLYVKREEIFTCDKCKSKNNVNDSEKTEVSQLLVELPIKTLEMENSCTKSVPFRLRTEIPTEEKVHVQGIVGGDPALFKGLSSVFSRELWKSTGYVPKKFNFKYREFPCWDDEENDEFSKRKKKDASKEIFSKSHDDDRCSTRSTKMRRSPDSRTQQDSGNIGGSLSTKREENDTQKTSSYASRKVILPPNSTTSTSNGACSSNELNEHNKPSPQSFPRNNSTPVHQTLPGLINEILSKSKMMTYEELCNAVLPHWPYLRKQNGERYAYSSHSQDVLDSLRNMHEWGCLAERGPKNNLEKKKWKLDVAEEESDEIESNKGGKKRMRYHSQGEEFSKRKKITRKRRRLSLQGKDIKVLRKRRNEEEVSEEDDDDAFSDTSEESVFCEEDEKKGEGNTTTSTTREVFASSSEEVQAPP